MKLSLLNQTQKEAVTFDTVPLMVIAGAGSGKTLVLTYRVAYLIKRGFKPSSLFITTFTNKAASEMTERLKLLIGENKSNRLKIGTFHSLCFKMYKDLLDITGHDYNYPRILKGGSRFMVMVSIVNSYKVNSEIHRLSTKDIKFLLNRVSYMKHVGLSVDDVKELYKGRMLIRNEGKFNESYNDEMTEYLVYKDYEEALEKKNMIDFDDMLLKTYMILKDEKNKAILENVRSKISHILVDEAQDLNIIQHKLIEILSGDNRSITLVLDDYQAIYSFRNVEIGSIFQFKEKYNATIIKLEQNYRSTKKIVNSGNKLITYNSEQIEKTLFTKNEEGDNIQFNIHKNIEDEASFIVNEIRNLMVDGYKLKDIAILYRVNAQSRAVVDELILNDINHKVYSSEGFYDRNEVKDIISYLKILNNPEESDMSDFRRIINKPKRYLGAKFINEVETLQIEEGYETYWDAIRDCENANLQNYQKRLGQGFVEDIISYSNYIKENECSLTEIIEIILDKIDYRSWLIKDNDNDEDEPDNDIRMNIDSLHAGVTKFTSIQKFLDYVDSLKFKETNNDEDFMHLMTVHKSKGMEFPVVFVIGVSNGIMPHYRADDKEEERRIAYVAITRSKKLLYLSSIDGFIGKSKVGVSQFIDEIGLRDEKKNKKVVLKKKSINDQIDEINKILG